MADYTISNLTGKVRRNSDGFIFSQDIESEELTAFIEWRMIEGNYYDREESFPGEQEAWNKVQDIEFEKYKYVQRGVDGMSLYALIMSEARYDLQHNDITQSDFESLQASLIPTRTELVAGQWDVAVTIFEDITLSQILHDKYFSINLQRINDYVSTSYTSISASRMVNQGEVSHETKK